MKQLVLGIETSCDETAASVVADGREVLSNVIASQIDLHRLYGGVVPEIASRKHVEAIIPVIDRAMQEANVTYEDLSAIAVTQGPGLVGSLLVGLSAAKALAYAKRIPLIGVNHIEGHIYANFLAHRAVEPPLVCLTVSGGHTDLLHIPAVGSYTVLGRTRDDAAGEAFDKVGRVLGLPYPAGPQIDALAVRGDPNAYPLPRALAEGLDFSFSGLKTAAINMLHNLRQRGEEIDIADFAASLQEAIVDVLVAKTMQAATELDVSVIIMSGGVAANTRLRTKFTELTQQAGIRFFYPPVELCTDNAAMIASAGYFRWARGERAELDLDAVPGLRLAQRQG
ncbi:MAG TPA: tRNA (adenosine(37)-N6)-threonylcarbamoyltransferase complex transferase subunit TsaD [Firmicutes bacterium]|nr:tRNA (adenosine(37)-N6)-threonylcarbamoyltransferase complex transferase subunit TsaD [Bacillota bacterium]